MATTKPRITITLEQEQYDALRRLSDLQGAPMSRIVSELLAEVTPMLAKLAETLEVASRAHRDIRANIRRTAQEAEEEILPLAEQARNQFDLFAQQLAAMVPSADAGGGADSATAAADRPSPQPVITGATTPNGTNCHSGKSASKRAK